MNSGFRFKVQSTAMGVQAPTSWAVPESGGTVGRSPDCAWVLDDPNRIVSRQHARVDIEDGQCHWTDLGTNTTQVNGKPMPQGQRVCLKAGDVLKIGEHFVVLEATAGDWSGLDEFMTPVQVDPLESLMPGAAPCLNIDDLLAEMNVPQRAEDVPRESLLAQRMYVGKQGAVETGVESSPPRVLIDRSAEVAHLKHLLEISVQGCMRLLQARRVFQQEMGGNLTTISSKGNNPLKFSGSAGEALQRLLAEPTPAYLNAEQALEQAYNDLATHMQLGVARIQALIDQVNSELDPQIIMDEANRKGGVTLGLSATRKARFWDLYCERFKKLGSTWN
ncbi:type VI secretion system-associated FHA domain protein [Limnobacter sp.]|uniref:type VI secretion system-associated FHA domain protein n=1 Tax=Limnobacter sp. TaxID=2003368 RepID=UPI002FE277CE